MATYNNSETQPLTAEARQQQTGNLEVEEAIFQKEPVNKKKKWVVGITVSLVLILVGLLLFFFWPRYPKVGFYKVELDKSYEPPANSKKIVEGLTERDGVMSLGLNLHLYANSTLFFDLQVKNITADVYMKTDNGDFVKVGEGHLKESISIPKRNDFFKFEMPVLISYNTTQQVSDSKDAFQQFLNKCGIDGNPKKPIQLKYIARVDIPLMSWTGYKPKFVKEKDFECPFDLELISIMRKFLNFFH